MTEKSTSSGDFGRVDKAQDTSRFLEYLETVTNIDSVRAYKGHTFDLLKVGLGDRVLDVGCGTGQDAVELAKHVGSAGRVVGVDASEAMVCEANELIRNTSLPIEFYHSRGEHLQFEEGTFDACRADRVLQHVEEPSKILSEMIRVLKPGGRLVVIDPDWDTCVIDAQDKGVTRGILDFMCDRIRNGWMGRQLFRMCKQQGLEHVAVFPTTLVLTDYSLAERIIGFGDGVENMQAIGALSVQEGKKWLDEVGVKVQHGYFFCSVTAFIVTGEKPR